jgi:hypothetical protein
MAGYPFLELDSSDGEAPVSPRAECEQHGITQVTDGSSVHIAWPDVTDVIAYKKDCYTIDQIRLEIISKEQNIMCTEEDQDPAELTSAIATYLHDFKSDSYSVGASSPAFEPTFTRLYPTGKLL